MKVDRITMTGLLLVAGAVALPVPSLRADDAQRTSPAETADSEGIELESLDDELFEGLDDEFDEAEGIQSDTEGEALSDEDLGSDADPATRIGHIMKRVRQRLEEQDLSEPTREEQKRIVRELEDWLKELQKRKKKSSPSGGESKPSPGAEQDRNAPQQQPGGSQGKPGPGAAARSQPAAAESSPDVREMKQEKVAFGDIRDSVENWGNLPEKERKLLRQMFDVELLPEYAPLIRRYFRRLAEENKD